MNARYGLLPLLCALALVACSHAQPAEKPAPPPEKATAEAKPAAPEEPVPALKLPPDARPTHYALHFTVEPEKDAFSGVADIDVTLDKARTVLWLNGRDLQVSQAWVEAN